MVARNEMHALRVKGLEHMRRREFEEAQKVFESLVKSDSDPSSRNNLATCRFKQGDLKGALGTLKPNLEAKVPNPFAHALAAQILAALGRREEAERHLARAISDFETGMKTVVPAGLVAEEPWREYTVIIKRAAGDLGNHRQVLELYRKWERHHVNPEDWFLAGVAAFNLGRFSQAASLWKAVARMGWDVADEYVTVASAVDAGIVPPFPLEYHVPLLGDIKGHKTAEGLRRLALQGWSRMLAFASILDPSDYEEKRLAAAQLRLIIQHGGDWGLDLARRILAAPAGICYEMKMAAARALVELGIHEEGESIEAVVDGKPRYLVIRTSKVVEEPDESIEALMKEATRLRSAGEIDEAIEKLQPLLGHGDFYPPAMLVLANLLRMKDQLDDAEGLLLTLRDIAPSDPVVLFNLAGLYIQRGDPRSARKCADQIDRRLATNDFRDKLSLLDDEIAHLERLTVRPSEVVTAVAEALREDQEDKPISLNTRLSQAVRTVPAGWVSAACKAHGIDPESTGRRQERAETLVRCLVNLRHLEKVASNLEEDERAVLRFVLNEGGWASVSALTRRFGSMEDDGFWWEETPPKSTLGRLRLKALLFIGRAVIDGHRHKVAVIPLELREGLTQLLGSRPPAAGAPETARLKVGGEAPDESGQGGARRESVKGAGLKRRRRVHRGGR
ncbi:MAG: tetratricopeptide repeat protein [Firmicutes bacterium]|nr:tetratricopeptide repeat protein [Bacillota bacterium]